jgi:type III restriction enzyme
MKPEFDETSKFELTPDMIPTTTTNEPFVGESIQFDLKGNAERLRIRSVIFDVAGHTLRTYFKDDEGNVEVWRYPELVNATETWFEQYLVTRGNVPKQYMKWRQFADTAARLIYQAAARGLKNEPDAAELQLPILDTFNPEGSTNQVGFTTSKKLIFDTTRSPVTHVVGDSGWELAFAEKLEQMDDLVLSYVKNHALHFEIPYWWDGQERHYRPDYILKVDDGHGAENPLYLIVEVKGLKDNQDTAKADTATAMWLPAVNNLGRFGRWAFVEIDSNNIYEAEAVIRGFGKVKEAA